LKRWFVVFHDDMGRVCDEMSYASMETASARILDHFARYPEGDYTVSLTDEYRDRVLHA